MAAVRLSATFFLASSPVFCTSSSSCSCTLRSCFCRPSRASSRSFCASLAARYFRMATISELTATSKAIAAAISLPWSPRKASRNVQSIELMALMAAPRYAHDTRQYALRVLLLDGFGSLTLFCSLTSLWAFMPRSTSEDRHPRIEIQGSTSECPAACVLRPGSQDQERRLIPQAIVAVQVAPFCPCRQPKKPPDASTPKRP